MKRVLSLGALLCSLVLVACAPPPGTTVQPLVIGPTSPDPAVPVDLPLVLEPLPVAPAAEEALAEPPPQETAAAFRQRLSLANADAFRLAAYGTSDEVAAALEAGLVANTVDASNQTLLMIAAVINPVPDVYTRLVAAGVNVNAVSNSGWTALMYAARDTSNPLVIMRLLHLGADARFLTPDGLSALDIARTNPHLQGTEALAALERALAR